MPNLRSVVPHKKRFLDDPDLGNFETYVKRGSIFGWVQQREIEGHSTDLLIMGTEKALHHSEKADVISFLHRAALLIPIGLDELNNLESNTYSLVSAGVLDPGCFTLTFQAKETSMLYDVVFKDWEFQYASPALND